MQQSAALETKFTIPEAAKAMKVSTVTVRRWIYSKKLNCYRAGRKILIGEHHINAFMQSIQNVEDVA